MELIFLGTGDRFQMTVMSSSFTSVRMPTGGGRSFFGTVPLFTLALVVAVGAVVAMSLGRIKVDEAEVPAGAGVAFEATYARSTFNCRQAPGVDTKHSWLGFQDGSQWFFLRVNRSCDHLNPAGAGGRLSLWNRQLLCRIGELIREGKAPSIPPYIGPALELAFCGR